MPKDTFLNLPEEKKLRIINGAKQAFSVKHYAAVSIDSIVEHAQIPKGSFYQYFLNKDDLFKYIFQDLGTKKKTELFEEMGDVGEQTFSQTIVQLVERANQFENRDEEMIALKERFLQECPQEVKNEILLDMIPDTLELFKTVLEIYVQKKIFRQDLDIDVVAFMLMSVVMNLEKYPVTAEMDHADVLIEACRMLEQGLIGRGH